MRNDIDNIGQYSFDIDKSAGGGGGGTCDLLQAAERTELIQGQTRRVAAGLSGGETSSQGHRHTWLVHHVRECLCGDVMVILWRHDGITVMSC